LKLAEFSAIELPSSSDFVVGLQFHCVNKREYRAGEYSICCVSCRCKLKFALGIGCNATGRIKARHVDLQKRPNFGWVRISAASGPKGKGRAEVEPKFWHRRRVDKKFGG
jgi:hypothetical protein